MRASFLMWLLLAFLAVPLMSLAGDEPYGIATRPGAANFNLPQRAPALTDWTTRRAFPALHFHQPTFVAQPRQIAGRLYVLEREGRIYWFEKDREVQQKHLFLDFRHKVAALLRDDGALGLAFHPEFGVANSPHRQEFFVFYTAREKGKSNLHVARFLGTPDRADPASETILIRQEAFSEFDEGSTVHNGGSLVFGPDGFLYVALGDRSKRNDNLKTSQKIDSGLFAGVLRIDVDLVGGNISHAIPRQPLQGQTQHYLIPNDNPFVGMPNALEEFWAIGLRNPHRIAFDAETGELWAGDVGQYTRGGEVELLGKGTNHQWSFREGFSHFSNSYLKGLRPDPLFGIERKPLLETLYIDGDRALIGGTVYRGKRFPALRGKYIYGDFSSGRVWALTKNDDASIEVERVTNLRETDGLAAIGDDRQGELYFVIVGSIEGADERSDPSRRAASQEDGYLLELIPQPADTVADQPPRWLSETGVFTDVKTMKPHPGLIPFQPNVPFWSDGARKTRWMALPEGGKIQVGPQGQWTFPAGTVFVKHFDLPVDDTKPSVTKRLETRILKVTEDNEVYGLTYRWLSEYPDAVLLDDMVTAKIPVKINRTTYRAVTWTFPSREQCLQCHTQNAGFILGPREPQLNGRFTYPNSLMSDNQIRTWNHLGLFDPPYREEDIGDLTELVPLSEESKPVEIRARSYLDVNCSYCHRPSGIQRAEFDARFSVPAEKQKIINGRVLDTRGIQGAKIVVPQAPELSLLLKRIQSDSLSLRMPPLGRHYVDEEAVKVIEQWIREMKTR